MLILALCVLAVASPLVAVRWPAGLVRHRWRWAWLIWAALAFQVAIMQFGFAERYAPALHIATYVVAGVFLWVNRSLPGVLIVGFGALLNGVTIAANGGVLPARPEALEAAGLVEDGSFVNSGVVEDPVFPWLGDVFVWPEPLPLANVFSIGDVVIIIGVVVAAWSGTRRVGASHAPALTDQQ